MSLLQVAANLRQQLLDKLLAEVMMNKLGFQFSEDSCKPLHRQVMLRLTGIEWSKRLLCHLACEFTKGKRA